MEASPNPTHRMAYPHPKKEEEKSTPHSEWMGRKQLLQIKPPQPSTAFFYKHQVILFSLAQKQSVEFVAGAVGCHKGRKGRRGCLDRNILQTENLKKKKNEQRGHRGLGVNERGANWTHAFGLMVASPMMGWKGEEELGKRG